MRRQQQRNFGLIQFLLLSPPFQLQLQLQGQRWSGPQQSKGWLIWHRTLLSQKQHQS
jgi:hypothetical protein